MESKKFPNVKEGVMIENFPAYFLFGMLAVVSVVMWEIYRPFFTMLLMAIIMGTAFHPVYDRVLKLFKGRQRTAAIVTCLLVLVLIMVPLVIFVLLLSQQAFDTYLYIQHQLQSGALDHYIKWSQGGVFYDMANALRSQIGPIVDVNSLDLKKNIVDFARSVAAFLFSQSATILKSFGFLLFGFFVMIFAMYYLFKDGHEIIEKLMKISPLPLQHEKELINKFKEISLGTLYGIFFTAILQGVVGGIGFAIVGIPNPVFWGTAMSVFSMVPFVGTASIWVPASIILLVSGNVFGGVFMFLWGLILVSTVDNFLRAYLIGGHTKMNQLLTFLAVIGGLGAFGLVGILFGPLILSFFFTLLHIYQLEYKSIL